MFAIVRQVDMAGEDSSRGVTTYEAFPAAYWGSVMDSQQSDN